MWRWVWRATVRQGSRWRALFATLAVASFAFAMLTAQSQESRLDVVQTADENARSAYDVLVRPMGSRLALESQRGLVQPGFLDIEDVGITLDQWRQIQALPGVEIAAPIAVVGWVVPTMQVPVDLDRATVTPDRPTLLRRTATWTYDNGASVVQAAPVLEYLTANTLTLQTDPGQGGSWLVERLPRGEVREHQIPRQQRSVVSDPGTGYHTACSSAVTDCRFTFHSVQPSFPFPFLVVAVDPRAEAELAGLDTALTSGAYLTDADPQVADISTAQDGSDPRHVVPVLMADQPTLDLSVDYRIEDLGADAARVATQGTLPAADTHGQVVDEGSWDAQRAYEELVKGMRTPQRQGAYYATSIFDVFLTGPVTYESGVAGGLTAEVASGDLVAWRNRGDIAEALVPPGADDTAFHELSGFAARGGVAPAIERIGTFDAEALVGSQLSEVPLGTYAFSPPRAANEASRAALGEGTWLPSANIWGFVQAPPLMVTSLSALSAFSESGSWEGVSRSGPGVSGATPVKPYPISAVRVRVAGVTGIDPTSRERVRLVAEQIAKATGLEVDITMGSSPAPQEITVPAGGHGRPEVVVEQNWVRKGVAVALVEAADRKSLLLNTVILGVSGVVVNNATLASVRARRRQLATLLMTGWTRGAVLRAELASLLLISVAAGLVAGVAAAIAGVLSGSSISLPQAALAVPAAVGVALVAGAAALLTAVRAPVLDAVRPTGATRLRSVSRRVRTIGGFARRTVATAPARALLSAGAVAVAVASLGVLLGIQLEFSGEAVGTLLGDAVALQVRGADLVAVAGIVVLAGVGVGHAGALEVRERAPELVLLRVTGWRSSHLTRLILVQGTVVGLIGSTLGAGLCLAFARWALGGITPAILVATGTAFVVGVVTALVGSLTPAHLLARTPSATVLAED